MTTAYDPVGSEADHPVLSNRAVAIAAVVVVLSVWSGRSLAQGRWAMPLEVVGGCLVAACLTARPGGVRRSLAWAVLAVVAFGAAARSSDVWSDASPRSLGPFLGWAVAIDDPSAVVPGGGSTSVTGQRIVLEIEGQRFEAAAWGPNARRLARLRSGDRVWIVGERRALDDARRGRAVVRHIVGDVRLDQIGDRWPGSRVAEASNRVRALLRRGAERTMAPDDAALFAGLVLGDDAREPGQTIDDFRASGLSHLTAVSGQNVGYVLAVAGIGLRRLSRWWRLAATLAVIAWFALLTRWEPSVLRAVSMAALSAWSYALGRDRHPTRLLHLAVIVLVVVDPMLVWSVAFWLSVGATLGVTAIAPVLDRRLGGPRWLAAPVAVTVGAQLGVALPSWLVFRRIPSLGLLANLLAAPVAGFVMLVGIPAGLLAATLPTSAATFVMAPASLGTRWVAVTARSIALLQPTGWVAVPTLAAQAAGVVWLWRRGSRTGGLP